VTPEPSLGGALGGLSAEALKAEQQKILNTPRRRYGLSSRLLFAVIDLLYGKPRTLSKFKVLELVARVPYQSWEQIAYIAITHVHDRTDMAKRISLRVAQSRAQQDNEQWHLLVLEEVTSLAATAEDPVRSGLVPQVLAFVYYQLSFVLYSIRPKWSYRLNADFEDHATHEYMTLVTEHPEWEEIPFDSPVTADYGTFESLAHLFRQIGYDEMVHRDESIASMADPRFH